MQEVIFKKLLKKSQTQSVFQKLINDIITIMEVSNLWHQILLAFTLDAL